MKNYKKNYKRVAAVILSVAVWGSYYPINASIVAAQEESKVPLSSVTPEKSEAPLPSVIPEESREPSSSLKPPTSETPSPSLKPTASTPPAPSRRPLVSEEPCVSQKPMESKEPWVSQQPPAPDNSEFPIVSETPGEPVVPTVSTAPEISEVPDGSEKPSSSEKPAYPLEPSGTPSPSPSGIPPAIDEAPVIKPAVKPAGTDRPGGYLSGDMNLLPELYKDADEKFGSSYSGQSGWEQYNSYSENEDVILPGGWSGIIDVKKKTTKKKAANMKWGDGRITDIHRISNKDGSQTTILDTGDASAADWIFPAVVSGTVIFLTFRRKTSSEEQEE